MVFIGNPRRGTNRVGGDRIILRSMQTKLHLQHTCSILSIKIEVVEVGVVLVFIPNFFLLKGVHPPSLKPSSTSPAVGTRFLTIFWGIFQGSWPLGTIFPVISTGTY